MCSSNILKFSIIEKIRVEKKMYEILDLLKTKKNKGSWAIFLTLPIVLVSLISKYSNNKLFQNIVKL